MAAFNDRQATLTRLSNLQREIEQLTDVLNRPSIATSLKYADKSTSSSTRRGAASHTARSVTKPPGYSTSLQPSTSYRSKLEEIEAKYARQDYKDSIKYVMAPAVNSGVTARQSLKTGGVSQSWTSDEWAGNPDAAGGTSALSSPSYSFNPAGGYQLQIQSNPSAYSETSQHQTVISSRLSQDPGNYSHHLPQSHSSSKGVDIMESFPLQRIVSQNSKELLDIKVQQIEDKYLHLDVSTIHDQGRLAVHSSHSSHSQSSHDVYQPKPWTRNWISPSTTEQSHKEPSLTSAVKEYSQKEKPNKYSWRQSHHKYPSETVRKSKSNDVHRSPFKYENSLQTGRRDTCSTSAAHGNPSQGTSHSKYRFDSRSTSGSANRKRRHSEDHHTHSVPYSSSKFKLTTKRSSNKSSKSDTRTTSSDFTHKHYFIASRSSGVPVRRSSSFVSSRGRGFASKRGYEYTRGRVQRFLSGRGHTFSTRRGHGFVIFRGRGTRGRGGRGAGFIRGQSSSGHSSSTTRVWRSPHSPGYHRKGSFSSHVYNQPSSKKESSQGGFRSRYALVKTSIARNTDKKPLSFMEKRRQTVLSKTPVLLRSKYNLIKGHRSVIRPVLSSMSLSMPSRKLSAVKRLVTVKNTKTKLIRREEGVSRPSGSVVNLQGTQFKLRNNRFSRTLYRIPPKAEVSPTSNLTSKASEKQGFAGHTLVLKSTTPSITRKVASHVLQRSIHISLAAKYRTKKQFSTKQYCMFYNLYGRCKRGDGCPYIHDPEKVAVCTRFLRGTCPKTDGSCLFSHKVSKEKMPVCSYFLRGVCNRDNCPYSHVKVNIKASICPDFIKGYCPLGEKCKKKHVLRCADFTRTGKCANGKKCPLLHKRDPAKSRESKTKKSVKRETDMKELESRTPAKKLKKREASFIELFSDTPAKSTVPSMSDTREDGSGLPSIDTEAPPIAGSREGSSIIPSFVRLSTVDRTKTVAPPVVEKVVSDMVPASIPQSPDDLISGYAETTPSASADGAISLSLTIPSSSNEPQTVTAPSTAESQEHLDSLPSSRQASADDPYIGTAPSLSQSGESSDNNLLVMAPSLSADGEGSSGEDMPSFIELSPGDHPSDPMEESTNTAQQESKKSLQIRPHFKKISDTMDATQDQFTKK